jgi:hypothetical protein
MKFWSVACLAFFLIQNRRADKLTKATTRTDPSAETERSAPLNPITAASPSVV